MNTEEKRKILYNYCGLTTCEKCALITKDWKTSPNELNCLRIKKADDKDLDKALSLIGYNTDDAVNKPSHYTDGKIEVIEYIEDKKLGFCLGNAIKYISRAGKKDPAKEIEDLKKAVWYINRRIKELPRESTGVACTHWS